MTPADEHPPVRPCQAPDLPAVLNLLQQLSAVSQGEQPFALESVERSFAAMERLPEVYLTLVYELEDHRTAGFLSLIFYKTLFHAGGTAMINELVVDGALRGMGIGRHLLERAVQEARSRGMDEIEVGAEKFNLTAQHFYKKNGFNEEYVLLGMEFGE
jgi:ribosomal protein S18 acetylase RimI-like enzyme